MKNTEKAFLWIVTILEKAGVAYKISGGLAARAYGARRELADIDIEVNNKDMLLIYNETKPYVVFGPCRYKDTHWDLELITIQYEGQEIDIAANEALILNQRNGAWESSISNLESYELIEIYNKNVPVEKLDTLIEYKTKLSRNVDIEDVEQLRLLKK